MEADWAAVRGAVPSARLRGSAGPWVARRSPGRREGWGAGAPGLTPACFPPPAGERGLLAHQARRLLLPRELVPQSVRGVARRRPAGPRGCGLGARLVGDPVAGLGDVVAQLLHRLPGPRLPGHRHQLAGLPGRLAGLRHRLARLGQRRRLVARLGPRRLVRELQRAPGGAAAAGAADAAPRALPGQGERAEGDPGATPAAIRVCCAPGRAGTRRGTPGRGGGGGTTPRISLTWPRGGAGLGCRQRPGFRPPRGRRRLFVSLSPSPQGPCASSPRPLHLRAAASPHPNTLSVREPSWVAGQGHAGPGNPFIRSPWPAH